MCRLLVILEAIFLFILWSIFVVGVIVLTPLVVTADYLLWQFELLREAADAAAEQPAPPPVRVYHED